MLTSSLLASSLHLSVLTSSLCLKELIWLILQGTMESSEEGMVSMAPNAIGCLNCSAPQRLSCLNPSQPDLQSATPADPSWTSSCRPPVLYSRHQPPAQFSTGQPVLQPAFTFSQIIRCLAAHQRGSVYVTDV